MRKQEANIYEIAKEAGVSIATVSRVINQSDAVSEKSRRKVQEAIKKLNYVPNWNARNLGGSVSTSVGVAIPDINNPFFSLLLQGVTRAADEQGLQVLLFNTDESSERERDVLRTMREHRLRGIIITPVSEQNKETVEQLERFESRGVPVVLMDREIESAYFDRVVTEDEGGAYRAVHRLLSEGHEKIAIITGPEDSSSGRKRKQGYLRAMEEFGVEVLPQYVREGDFKVDRAYEQTLALMALEDPPTAIFASNNMTTYGCLKAFHHLGLRVGENISLIGFDDIEALQWLNYNISVVSRDVPRMGEYAMRLLIQRFESESRSREGKRTCLPTELILRGSECRSQEI